MILPNFMVIGGAKAATSSMATYLVQHPDVYMSPVKEPHYFSSLDGRFFMEGPHDRQLYKGQIHTTAESYASLFADAGQCRAVGESSTTYLSTPGTAVRIKQTLPQVKLVAILRNPVERAYSCYMHLVRDGLEDARTFEEALAAEPERILRRWDRFWHYKELGFYKRQLEEYYEHFPRENIKLFLYDDLRRDVHAVLREIFLFVGVDPMVRIDTSNKVNVGGIPVDVWYHRLTAKKNLLKTAVKYFLPPRWRAEWKEKIVARNLHRPPMRPETKKMLQAVYREDILALQELIQRDLGKWLE